MRGLGEAAAYVWKKFNDLGLHPSPSSRLGMMFSLFEKRDFIPEGDSDFELACEALRDITLLEFAFDQLAEPHLLDSAIEKLRLLLKDSALPQDDDDNTPGRDTQAEIYVASICQAAGLSPKFLEPDVVVVLNDKEYGIAVKRLKSLASLEKRFHGACKQIQKAGKPGFIVLDMMMVFNPENRRVWATTSDAHVASAHSLACEKFVGDYFDRFRKWQDGREVRGVLILDHLVRRFIDQDDTPRWQLNGFAYSVNMSPHNERRRREGDAFWRAYERGIPYSSLSKWM